MRFSVRVTPRGGRNAIDGWTTDDAGRPLLKVRVSVPPADGEANAAVVALIAKALKRPRSAVAIVSGQSARVKQVEADGVTPQELAVAFGPPPHGQA